jgi:hypothetical protein
MSGINTSFLLLPKYHRNEWLIRSVMIVLITTFIMNIQFLMNMSQVMNNNMMGIVYFDGTYKISNFS